MLPGSSSSRRRCYRLVAAFVHACWLQLCSPIVAQLMLPEIDAALEDSEDFVSSPVVTGLIVLKMCYSMKTP